MCLGLRGQQIDFEKVIPVSVTPVTWKEKGLFVRINCQQVSFH